MVAIRMKVGYVYVFEGPRPGTLAAVTPAYEVEVEPGKWKTVKPTPPDPTDPNYTMGKRWLALAGDESNPIDDIE